MKVHLHPSPQSSQTKCQRASLQAWVEVGAQCTHWHSDSTCPSTPRSGKESSLPCPTCPRSFKWSQPRQEQCRQSWESPEFWSTLALSSSPGLIFHRHTLSFPGGSQVSMLIILKGGATCPDPNYTMCIHLFPIKQLQVPELCILSETMCWVIFKYYLQNTYVCCQETINYKLPPVPRATTWLPSPCKSFT